MQEYTSVEDQVFYGLDSIDPDQKVEISLRDLVFITKSISELNQFFHQPMHYPSLADVEQYIGNINSGAYSLIHRMNYHMLWDYLPADIRDKMGWETTELINPNPPYYYKPKE
ncbi:hypothetical protein E4631_09775 [Hymenobacter sp. UV11]|uniref:hypothetical protein n=1 Tax=Hymenobacter sp. UV11 TaxID=1849735 RepID=UPI00105E49F1|nr:hypothetical protein [Hymenobacter sp. UV11]TFZ66306.1 hypothetical protein E4631_09775 [Hymenobacter sp. UV11]